MRLEMNSDWDIRISGSQVAGCQEIRESGWLLLITCYPDNHLLITCYPDNHLLMT